MSRPTLEVGDWGNPEAFTTGLNFSAGRWSKPIPKRGFEVVDESHWVFKKTGLQKGDVFGLSEGVIGYETDAAVYDLNGQPIAPTPANFRTLATAFLPDWDDWYGRAATMGIFEHKGGGSVLTAGSTGWGRGLLKDGGHVHQITKNIVEKLSC